jgi:hypothetical protein
MRQTQRSQMYLPNFQSDAGLNVLQTAPQNIITVILLVGVKRAVSD